MELSEPIVRVIKGAIFGFIVIVVCTLLCLFEGLQKVMEFGVASGVLTLVHLTFAIFSRQIVSGLSGLPWFRGRQWTEYDAGVYAAQFAIGLTAVSLIAGVVVAGLVITGELALIAIPLLGISSLVAYRRRDHQRVVQAATA